MNRFPWWKNLIVFLVLVFGLLFASPNLFQADPAIQVSQQNVGASDALLAEVEAILTTDDIAHRELFVDQDRLMVSFDDDGARRAAKEKIEAALDETGGDFIVALNQSPRLPSFMRSLGLQPMSLGLDLRGGVHFLLDVDMDAAMEQTMEAYESDIKAALRKEKIRYRSVRAQGDVLRISLRSSGDLEQAEEIIDDETEGLLLQVNSASDDFLLTGRLTDDKVRERQDFAIQQNIITLRNRVNELGVAEPIVQRQGVSRIVVQLPGVQDTAEAKRILGATATLEFRAVDENNDPFAAQTAGRAPAGSLLFFMKDSGAPILLKRDVIARGDELTDASSTFDENGAPAVSVNLDAKAGQRMLNFTKANVGKRMAVVFIETKPKLVTDKDGNQRTISEPTSSVISAATVQGVFSNRFQITGLDSGEARDLALLLRAGALAAPVNIVEERTIGPTLGQDNIDKGFKATWIGLVAVMIFMIVYYRAFGFVANLALATNIILLVALLSMLQASLTLPGIAGIVLTVGMAVDANVLIFERIREEIRNGSSPQASIHAGYEKAFSSIADANVTTLIAAVVLLTFGTGPIKGFAITLSLGILTSMFTAIMGTRAVVNLIYGNRRVERLAI